MTYENLLYEVQNNICTITLNRPQVYNALSPELIQEITKAMQEAESNDDVRVIVITGTGDKAFCSGADLKASLGSGTFSLGDSLRKNYNPMILTIRNLAKPIICRLNGIAAGAGCSLALACDVIVASEDASLSQIFAGIGLIMDAGSSYFLPRMIGSLKAFELCSTARKVPAQECFDLGLVSQVVPATQLDQATQVIAQQYAQAPTQAIGLIKKVLNQSYHSTLAEMLELEATNQDIAGKTQDFVEGVTAFLQKRPAKFKGK
jgi:2-(1,2-epoxy-1,2-dihydrophenyl)acetyl-CoA isomerase